ncbi:MAG: hypothetical protein KAU26_05985 [Methylococcales bacterium]|nr:hypothetical protein [Methylococcales bacterium]
MKLNPLSKQAINQAILSNSVQHPMVLYSSVAGVLALLSGSIFNLGSFPVIFAAGAMITAVGGWIFQCFAKGDAYSKAYFEKIHARLAREKTQKITTLKKQLALVESPKGIKQLELVENKYRNFEDILNSKLSPTEMTYSRYLSMAEQVYLAVLDNLDQVYLTLKSISAMDKTHLTESLYHLEDNDSATAEKERKTLTKRLHLYEQQQTKTASIMLANERALTELDQVSAQMASVQMNKGRADLDLDQAMDALHHLAERTDQYARR